MSSELHQNNDVPDAMMVMQFCGNCRSAWSRYRCMENYGVDKFRYCPNCGHDLEEDHQKYRQSDYLYTW